MTDLEVEAVEAVVRDVFDMDVPQTLLNCRKTTIRRRRRTDADEPIAPTSYDGLVHFICRRRLRIGP